MKQAIESFRDSADRVEQLGGLHKAISVLTTPVIDTSDLLRAQIVLIVSALDYYIHELTALGMVEAFEGKRIKTQAFLNFRVSVGSFSNGASHGSSWFESEIREKHGFLSFQQPDKVADAIRLFSDVKIWKEVSAKMGIPEQDVKNKLKLIVDRRNKIAHEADLDPSYPGLRWPINEQDVTNSIKFIKNLCENIHIVAI